MNSHLALLRRSPLFEGIADSDILPMLRCLSSREVRYSRVEFLLLAGSPLRELGVVLEGEVLLFTEDYWGNRNIIASLSPGDLFGEVFACSPDLPAQVSAEAAANAAILWLDGEKVLSPCCQSCAFHRALLHNLFQVVTAKNRLLTEKIGYLTRRTTREKLLAYLSHCAQTARSSHFTIPFNRQQLADYLSVDRSAMSNELCKLRDQGVLTFDKNHFTLR